MALYGSDQSHYQAVGNYPGTFGIFKATFGVPDNSSENYVDPLCDQHYQAAKAQGRLLGVYHFAYPTLNAADAEANYYVNNIQGYLGEAVLALDFETNTNVAWALEWLNRVYALTQVRPFIYMSASVCTTVDWTPVYKAGYALWAAGYPKAFSGTTPPTPLPDGSDMPYNTGAWPFATMWQYSDSAGTLDRDIFYGTADAWHKFAQGDRNVSSPTTTQSPTPTPSTPTSPAPTEPTVPTPPAPVPEPSEPTTGTPADPATPPVIHIPAPVGADPQAPVAAPKPPALTLWEQLMDWIKNLWKK